MRLPPRRRANPDVRGRAGALAGDSPARCPKPERRSSVGLIGSGRSPGRPVMRRLDISLGDGQVGDHQDDHRSEYQCDPSVP